MSGDNSYPSTPDSETAKALGHLPLHPGFRLLLSAFTAVTSLFVYGTTFRHFNDFLGMVDALPALQSLTCEGVQFVTLGPLPTYTKQRTHVGGHGVRPFAPNLGELVLVCPLQHVKY